MRDAQCVRGLANPNPNANPAGHEAALRGAPSRALRRRPGMTAWQPTSSHGSSSLQRRPHHVAERHAVMPGLAPIRMRTTNALVFSVCHSASAGPGPAVPASCSALLCEFADAQDLGHFGWKNGGVPRFAWSKDTWDLGHFHLRLGLPGRRIPGI